MSQLLTIQQLANILQVEVSTVRYWEKEFAQYLPAVGKNKRRRYTQEHVETFNQIKELLYTEQYTIKGAKRRLDLERTLTSALGVEQSLNSTVLFMFSAIMEELQKTREESRKLAKEIELLRQQKEQMEQRLIAEQNKSILEFLKCRLGGKSSQAG
ncbi:MAG: MerR family transcriptional regulator [Thermoanaerobacteraceae bacterium]|nr:MerR family transcriptional regulator [Thermoanaerobacteraceae bacterium]